MGKPQYIGIAIFIALFGALPLAVGNPYYLGLLVFLGINVIAAIGLCMLMGYAGQISLGHAGFFAIGGYSSAILTKTYGWHPVPALGIGIVLAVIAGLAIGIPALRLRGHYLAMATLGFGEIVYISANAAVGLTGGPSGFSGVPSISIAGIVFKSELMKYYLVWGIALVVLVVSLNIIHSRVGRALRSIHGDQTAAGAMGVNVAGYKIRVFLYSAALAAVAGSLYVHHMNFVSPSGFSMNKSILFLIMIMSGGIGSLWGAVIGAGLFTILPRMLRVFNDYDILVYGAVLLGMMMFMPDGLVGLGQRLWRKARTWKQP